MLLPCRGGSKKAASVGILGCLPVFCARLSGSEAKPSSVMAIFIPTLAWTRVQAERPWLGF